MQHAVDRQHILHLIVAVLLSVLSSAVTSTSTTAEAHDGTVLSAVGTAIVDGTLSPGEWDNAACAHFELQTLGDAHPSTLCAMNDENHLFLAVIIRNEDFKPSSFGSEGDILTLFFDNNHSGGIAFTDSEHGDDFVQLQQGFLGFFLDAFRCLPPVCAFPTFGQDVDFGGTTDAAGAISHTNPTLGAIGDYVYEIRKALNSGDTQHDFTLAPGSIVGVFLHFVDTPVGTNSGTSASWPGPAACASFSATTPCVGADIVIATPVVPVTIDIKPGSLPNSINQGSAGVVPVAIVSSSTAKCQQPPVTDNSTAGRYSAQKRVR